MGGFEILYTSGNVSSWLSVGRLPTSGSSSRPKAGSGQEKRNPFVDQLCHRAVGAELLAKPDQHHGPHDFIPSHHRRALLGVRCVDVVICVADARRRVIAAGRRWPRRGETRVSQAGSSPTGSKVGGSWASLVAAIRRRLQPHRFLRSCPCGWVQCPYRRAVTVRRSAVADELLVAGQHASCP
jgi:hypothetical protein